MPECPVSCLYLYSPLHHAKISIASTKSDANAGKCSLHSQVHKGAVVIRCLRWTPHPVIVTIRDNRDYIRVLSYSYYYTTTTGWGVLLIDTPKPLKVIPRIKLKP